MTELVQELDPSEAGARIMALMPQDIRQALASPHVQIFLAWDNDRAVGLSRGDILFNDPIFRLRDNPRCGYVDQMYVRPGYRDHSVGERLLGLCERWFKQQGVHHVLLHAAPKAVRFYARCGYQPNREMFKELT
jgi:GNAT superfamily N-acetyltransferase